MLLRLLAAVLGAWTVYMGVVAFRFLNQNGGDEAYQNLTGLIIMSVVFSPALIILFLLVWERWATLGRIDRAALIAVSVSYLLPLIAGLFFGKV